jgi:two-component system response regulator (stage 0 sporulation protein F)
MLAVDPVAPRKFKVLIVEDEPALRKLYDLELRREGYEVSTARNGPEALARVEAARPDLVVLDVRLPGMDGLEVLERILEREPELPVILNSAYSSYRDSFRSWSADAYLSKSSDLSELKATIRGLLEERVGACR